MARSILQDKYNQREEEKENQKEIHVKDRLQSHTHPPGAEDCRRAGAEGKNNYCGVEDMRIKGSPISFG